MRIFGKLLVVLCVFALLTVGCVFATLAAGREGSVDELNELIATAEGTKDPDEMYKAVLAVAEYLNTREMDDGDYGYDAAMESAYALCMSTASGYLSKVSANDADAAYENMMKADELLGAFAIPEDTDGFEDVKASYDAALVKAAGAVVGTLDANIETTRTTAVNKIAVNKAKNIFENCIPYGDESLLAGVEAQFAPLLEAHERATAANYAALDNKNYISNYDLPTYFSEDWQSSRVGLESNFVGSKWNVQLLGSKNKIGTGMEDDGNIYMMHKILDADNPTSSYAQIGLTNFHADKGLVIEFDITTFGEMPENGMFFETGSVGGAYFPPHYFAVNGNGDICKNDKTTVVLPGAIVKGQWLHIAIVLEPEEFIYELYVEGQFITTYDAKYEGKTRYDHTKVAFRMSGEKGHYGEIAIDNLKIYAGNAYRIHDKLTSMTPDELFVYYVNYLNNDANPISERNVAYRTVAEDLSKYWVYTNEETGEGYYTDLANSNPKIKEAVDIYLAFDLDELIVRIKSQNIVKFADLVTEFEGMTRTYDTIIDRANKATAISDFLTKTGDMIDRYVDNNNNGVSDYSEFNTKYTALSNQVKYDENAILFVRYMDRFEQASTLTAKERYYTRADELVDNGEIDMSIINNPDHPERDAFQNLVDAYAKYLESDAALYKLTKQNNAYKIVVCMNQINNYVTVEQWIEHSDEMNKYLGIVKDIVLGSDANGEPLYDTSYAGIKDAVAFFNDAYSYFYAILQDEHVAYIGDILDRIQNTDSYIEKIGMVSAIDRYIATNDINYNDARLVTLLNNLDTCKSELELRKEDYAYVLIQNSVYFVNLVEKMRTSDTYGDQKAYYESAALLYFNIDATVEGAANAINIFDEYTDKLRVIEESSIDFINAVGIYQACQTEDEKYAALVECYYNAQFVELSYEGAEEAMAAYTAAYNEYMGYAEAVNADLLQSGNAVGSFRANCGITVIVAIIVKKIFGV